MCILEGKNEDIHVKWESRDEKKSEKVPDNHENKIHPELMGMEEALPAEDLALSWYAGQGRAGQAICDLRTVASKPY